MEREPRFVLDGNLHDDLKRLIAIAAAPVKTDSDDITQIERYRDELLANKSGLFHKGLMWDPWVVKLRVLAGWRHGGGGEWGSLRSRYPVSR